MNTTVVSPIVIALCIAGSCATAADTVIINPSDDGALYTCDGCNTVNNGGYVLVAGYIQGIVKFPTAQISGSISQAFLTVNPYGLPLGDLNVDVYGIRATNGLIGASDANAGTFLGTMNLPPDLGYGQDASFDVTGFLAGANSPYVGFNLRNTSGADVFSSLEYNYGHSAQLHVSVVPLSPPPIVGPFTNGSFESPVLDAGASVNLLPGSTVLAGWTVGNTGLVSWRNGPAYDVAPIDGSQESGFNGADTPPGGSISQTFSTAVGQTYQVRFNVGRQGPDSGSMSLRARITASDGQLLGSLTAAAPASPGYGPVQGFTFAATSTNSTVTFDDTSSATVAVDVLLDNVSIVTSSPQLPPTASLVNNGGFETPPGINTYQVFGVGSNLPGWTVENGTVEIVGPYWQSAEGSQSLDLNGTFENIGTIYQDVPTVAGQSYKVRFAYAGNPECGSTVAIKSFKVLWNDAEFASLQFDTTGKSFTNMGWQYYESVVTASSSTSRLRFKSTSPAFCGPTLDDISLTPVNSQPPPPPCVPPLSGLVSWWPGEGNANDLVGSNNGTLLNGVSFAEGIVGQAFNF